MLVLALVLAIGGQAMLLEDLVGIGEVEQGTRRDAHDELVFECLRHATTSCPAGGAVPSGPLTVGLVRSVVKWALGHM